MGTIVDVNGRNSGSADVQPIEIVNGKPKAVGKVIPGVIVVGLGYNVAEAGMAIKFRVSKKGQLKQVQQDGEVLSTHVYRQLSDSYASVGKPLNTDSLYLNAFEVSRLKANELIRKDRLAEHQLDAIEGILNGTSKLAPELQTAMAAAFAGL